MTREIVKILAATLVAALVLIPLATNPSQAQGPAPTATQVCTDSNCGDGSGETLCTACQLYRQALTRVQEDGLVQQASVIENGVILRVTSSDPEAGQLLWEVAVARNEILESVHHGKSVPLCSACRANVDVFSELRIIVQRIPMGVLQVYTSSSSEMVHLLQAMVLAEQELPL